MAFLYLFFAVLSLGLASSAPKRLRELFDSVKEFSSATGNTPSAGISNSIIDSAIRYAKEDGRPLESFMDVLQTVLKNGISKTSLDQMTWEAVEQLYKQPTEPDASVISSPTLETSFLGKRGLEDEESRPVTKEKVLWTLRQLQSLSENFEMKKIGFELEVLNYAHYKMVENGDYDLLWRNLELLGATVGSGLQQSAFHAFKYAFEKMINPSFVLRSKELEEGLNQRERTLRRVAHDKGHLLSKLKYVMDHAETYRAPQGKLQEMEEILFSMAQRGDIDGLFRAMKLHDHAGASLIRRRTLFQRAYYHLLESATREVSAKEESQPTAEPQLGLREKVLGILEKQRTLPRQFKPGRIHMGMKLQNYLYYKMVEKGEYEKILYDLELMGAVSERGNNVRGVFYLFEDAYKKLMDPSYILDDPNMEEAARKHRFFLSLPQQIGHVLPKIKKCTECFPTYREPVGVFSEMEERLLDMAHRGDFDGLLHAVVLFGHADLRVDHRRSLFQRVYEYLMDQKGSVLQ